MMSHQKIVNYARALFNIKGSLEQIEQRQQDLEEISEIVSKTPDLLSLLSYPELAVEQKLSLLETLLQRILDPFVKKMIGLLIKQRKIKIIRKLFAEYHKLVVYSLKEMDIVVSTGEPLMGEERSILKGKLGDKFQKKVNLIEIVDPTLLGGFTILIHNQMLDLSIKGKLMNLKKQLLKAGI